MGHGEGIKTEQNASVKLPVTTNFEPDLNQIRGTFDCATGVISFLSPENLTDFGVAMAYRVEEEDREPVDGKVVASKIKVFEVSLVPRDHTFFKMEVVQPDVDLPPDVDNAFGAIDQIAHSMRMHPEDERDIAVLGSTILKNQTVVLKTLRLLYPLYLAFGTFSPDFITLLPKHLGHAKKALEIQQTDGNWDYDPYMHGMLNGMEFVLATIEGRDCEFRDAPAKWRTQDLTEFVEDLAKHGLRFDLNPTHDLRTPEMFFHDYIQRMDDSIRGRALDALTFEPREGEINPEEHDLSKYADGQSAPYYKVTEPKIDDISVVSGEGPGIFPIEEIAHVPGESTDDGLSAFERLNELREAEGIRPLTQDEFDLLDDGPLNAGYR